MLVIESAVSGLVIESRFTRAVLIDTWVGASEVARKVKTSSASV